VRVDDVEEGHKEKLIVEKKSPVALYRELTKYYFILYL